MSNTNNTWISECKFIQTLISFWIASCFRSLQVRNAESHFPVHPYETLEAQLPSVLVDELHGLLLYIGHLSELPTTNTGAFVNQNQTKVWFVTFNFWSFCFLLTGNIHSRMREISQGCSYWTRLHELKYWLLLLLIMCHWANSTSCFSLLICVIGLASWSYWENWIKCINCLEIIYVESLIAILICNSANA